MIEELKKQIVQIIKESHASYFLRHSTATPSDTEQTAEELLDKLLKPLIDRGAVHVMDGIGERSFNGMAKLSAISLDQSKDQETP